MLVHVASHGGVLIGTNGRDFFDQFQYLAWIRDAGSHGLASNLWVIGHTPHDYLHPMYLISGLLWRLGVSVQVAYLIWKPVALLVLFLGCAWYVTRLEPDNRARQTAALVLALFYQSPAYALAVWTGHLTLVHRLALLLASAAGPVYRGSYGQKQASGALPREIPRGSSRCRAAQVLGTCTP